MADKLVHLAAAVAEHLQTQARHMGNADVEWHVWDSATNAPRPELQLGHGPNGHRQVWAYTRDPVFRGLVLQRCGGRYEWEIDGGRGRIGTGSTRSLGDFVDRGWHATIAGLVDPVDVVYTTLARVAGRGRPGLGPLRREGTIIKWGAATARLWLWTPTIEINFVAEGVSAGFEQHRRREVHARHHSDAADLGNKVVGVLLDLAEQIEAGEEPLPKPLPAVWLSFQDEWRPAAAPAAVRDAVTGNARTELDGKWRERLAAYRETETPAQMRRRQKAATDRLQGTCHLPRGGGTGQATDWSGEVGCARIPVDSSVIAALWAIGLGTRLISELLAGNHSMKSAVYRRVREINGKTDAGGLVERPAREVVAEMGLAAWVRPAAEPGASAGQTFDDLLGQQDDATRRFVANLPERSNQFLRVLFERGELSVEDAMKALDLSVRRAFGGVTGSLARWAPIRGVPLPYYRDGDRFTWVGWP